MKKTESYLLSLPTLHQKLLSKYREHLQEVKICIENNDDIIKLILKDVSHIFENVSPTSSHDESVRFRTLFFQTHTEHYRNAFVCWVEIRFSPSFDLTLGSITQEDYWKFLFEKKNRIHVKFQFCSFWLWYSMTKKIRILNS